MPKKLVYKKIGERIKQILVRHEAEYDELGNLVKDAYEELVDKIVPIMGTVYEEMTQEEIDGQPQEDIPIVKSTEDRVSDLEEVVNGLKKLIEGFIKK